MKSIKTMAFIAVLAAVPACTVCGKVTASRDYVDEKVAQATNSVMGEIDGKLASATPADYETVSNRAMNSVQFELDVRTNRTALTVGIDREGEVGAHSVVFGAISSATGTSSFAHGYGARAYGDNSHAEGMSTMASGGASHAEGNASEAIGAASHAEGVGTLAEGYYAHSEGMGTAAYGSHSHAEGEWTKAYGDGSHAEGSQTIASNKYAHAEGIKTAAYGVGSHAEGYNTFAKGEYSHAGGMNAYANDDHSYVWGGYGAPPGLQASKGRGSFCVYPFYGVGGFFIDGKSLDDIIREESAVTKVNGRVGNVSLTADDVGAIPNSSNVRISGYDNPSLSIVGTNAISLASVMLKGSGCAISIDSGEGHSIKIYSMPKLYTNALSQVSYRMKSEIEIDDIKVAESISFLKDNAVIAEEDASGRRTAFAFGDGLNSYTNKGTYSFAQGVGTFAKGRGAHAEGSITTASGFASHAEGHSTTASGYYSHAEGYITTASGESSHAEGYGTIASAQSAHALGYFSVASNDFSYVWRAPEGSGAGSRGDGTFSIYPNGGISGFYVDGKSLDTIIAKGSAVTKVNGKTGDVSLTSEDIGALPATGGVVRATKDMGATLTVDSYNISIEDAESGKGVPSAGLIAVNGALGSAGKIVTYDSTTNAVFETGDGTIELMKRSKMSIDAEDGIKFHEGTRDDKVSIDLVGTTIKGTGRALGDGGSIEVGKRTDSRAADAYIQIVDGPAISGSGARSQITIPSDDSISGDNVLRITGSSIEVGGEDIVVLAINSLQKNDNGSFVVGDVGMDPGQYALANGKDVAATNDYSHAEGIETHAFGAFSHAEGDSNFAVGAGSHTEGSETIAEGVCAHAEGRETVASGETSHAEGDGAKAIGRSSHAEGFYTKAIGTCSHAEGTDSIAEGNYSHAGGVKSHAVELFSYAWCGENRSSTNRYKSHGVGTYNINPEGGLGGLYIGDSSLSQILSNGVARISSTDGRRAIDAYGNVIDTTGYPGDFSASNVLNLIGVSDVYTNANENTWVGDHVNAENFPPYKLAYEDGVWYVMNRLDEKVAWSRPGASIDDDKVTIYATTDTNIVSFIFTRTGRAAADTTVDKVAFESTLKEQTINGKHLGSGPISLDASDVGAVSLSDAGSFVRIGADGKISAGILPEIPSDLLTLPSNVLIDNEGEYLILHSRRLVFADKSGGIIFSGSSTGVLHQIYNDQYAGPNSGIPLTARDEVLNLIDEKISTDNDKFSNAVLAVSLNIDTNSVAVLNEIASTFGGFPIEGTATTIGGLLAALAAAIAWLKRNKADKADVDALAAKVGNANARLEEVA